MNITQITAGQKEFFATGKTHSYAFRKQALTALENAILLHQNEIYTALQNDLGKSQTESYMCEVGMVLSEITYVKKHLKRWMKETRVATPLAQFCAKSSKMPCPYGTVLIMSPWNYPFLLTIEPLIDAIAAGNTAVVKPSDYSPSTSALMAKLLSSCFDASYVATVLGGREVNQTLLDTQFDYIFFTGSKNVGRLVMEKAARYLTPISLELGGKSPCIVDQTANLKIAAKRIVFGKYLNCGQTCVAPDYVLVQKSVAQPFAALLKEEIVRQFGQNPLQNPDYGKIVNHKHFERLCSLLAGEPCFFGGQFDSETCKIAPAVLYPSSLESPAMKEEIFGPILPVLTYEKFDDIYEIIEQNKTPLALYLFTQNKEHMASVKQKISFGGGCINDTIIHLATSKLAFGGVGESGMGSYHGKNGFDTFTHYKSMVDKKTWIDLPMRYQPYTQLNKKLIKLFLK